MSQRIIIDRHFVDKDDDHVLTDEEVVLIQSEKDGGETQIQFMLDISDIPHKAAYLNLSINKTDLLVALAGI